MTRVLLFNFLGGLQDRGIPLYASEVAECMRRLGVPCIELRGPRLLGSLPRALRNLLFVVFEQIVAPLARVVRGCSVTVYPYNSAGVLDALLGRSILVVHDFIPNARTSRSIVARYIRLTQWVHRKRAQPVCGASMHTVAMLRRLKAFERCPVYLWTNAFYAFEHALESASQPPREAAGRRRRVLLCSGIGPNKDYGGALRLFAHSRALRHAELRVIGFGDDAHLAQRRLRPLSQRVRERITVLPRLDIAAVAAEYRAADLVWVHSRREGFGRSVVEALLSRRPVLATDIPAFRKLARPGVWLYRGEGFDAKASAALEETTAPSIDARGLQAELERRVRDVLARHAAH